LYVCGIAAAAANLRRRAAAAAGAMHILRITIATESCSPIRAVSLDQSGVQKDNKTFRGAKQK
jgi:hypothetical protein